MSDNCEYGEVVSNEEMVYCPDCEAPLDSGHVEFTGEGMAVVQVSCPECQFGATEEWVHDRTVRIEE